MADRLGIITRYQQHEVAHAAVHLAERARDQGLPSTIYGKGVVRREVARVWDSAVVSARQQRLLKWAQRCSRIIWTHVPRKRELRRIKHLDVETALLIEWERLTPNDAATVLAFDKIIIPYRCVGHALQRHWQLDSTTPIMMPWDVPVPISRRNTDEPHNNLCVYFPLYDTQPQRSDQAIFDMMHRTLAEVPHANVMIACGRKWSLSSKRIVKDLRKQFGDRVVLVLHPNILHRLMLFARADLTVWASRFESFGLIGLNSLCMGAPVLSWDMRPQNEFLKSWKNSVLVPAKTKENWLGVPEVISGYREFADTLVSTLQDRALIVKMKKQASIGLLNRRKQFAAGWTELQR